MRTELRLSEHHDVRIDDLPLSHGDQEADIDDAYWQGETIQIADSWIGPTDPDPLELRITICIQRIEDKITTRVFVNKYYNQKKGA